MHAEAFESELKEGEVSMGTTIMAITFDGGVILGADSRTSTGNYIANRVTDKLTQLTDNVSSFCHPYLLVKSSKDPAQAHDMGERWPCLSPCSGIRVP